MPRLPIAAPATFGRRASGADFGALEAEAQGQTGAVVSRGIGELVEVGARIKQAADEIKVGRQAAELSAALDRARFDLDADPDIDTHEERFEKASQDLIQKAKDGLDPAVAQRLDDRVFPALAHSKLEVSANVRKRRISNADADRKQMLQLNSDQAAQTFDPVRRGQIRGQTVGMLDRALGSGLIDQAAYDASIQAYDRGVSEADLRRMTRENPAEVFRRLEDPADPLAAGFDAAEIEQWRTQALNESEQQMRERRENERWAQAQKEKAERDQADAASKQMDDLLAKGDLAGAQRVLAQNRDVLSADQYRFFLNQFSGAGGKPARTVPDVYIELDTKAGTGASVTDEADAAYRRGQLTKADRDRIIKASEDVRVAPVQRFLNDALRPGILDRISDEAKSQAADIKRRLADWAADHPKASGAEVRDAAAKILAQHGKEETARLLRDGTSSSTDPAELTARAMEQFANDPIALDRELKRIEDLEQAQKLGGTAQ